MTSTDRTIRTDGKPHVVIIGKYYPPEFGGIERYTADVARSVAGKCRVTVVVHNTGPDDSIEHDGDVTIVRCGTTRIRSGQPISPSMWRHLRRLKPDLIQFNAPNFWASAMLCVLHRQCPVIVTHHADVFGRRALRQLVLPFYRALVRRSVYVVVNSLKNARISPDLPKDIRSIVEIPWGVDETPFLDGHRAAATPAEKAERFGDAFVVGFIGRFVRYKGLAVLIKALARLRNVEAILIGDGPLRPQVERQIAALGLTGRVHLLGNIPEARKIKEMSYFDVLAFPSLETTEAFGLVQVEAQLLGKPVIASELPTGVTDITDNSTGILVPVGDDAALANALQVLQADPERAAELGEAGRKRANARFLLRVFEQRMAELINTCLAEHAGQQAAARRDVGMRRAS